MKGIKIGLLSTLVIGVLSAFATRQPDDLTTVFYQKTTATGDCVPSSCNLNAGITCNAANTTYYTSQDTDPNHCVTPATLRRQN